VTIIARIIKAVIMNVIDIDVIDYYLHGRLILLCNQISAIDAVYKT
jgi:hypothetical protein